MSPLYFELNSQPSNSEIFSKYLLELGRGFAFVGRQYHLSVSDKDFYLDLHFYHLHLRFFVIINLKKGDFKLEYGEQNEFLLLSN